VDTEKNRVRQEERSDVLVTVVMPAYNAARWIRKGIDSVLAQTLSDWELIVVNDGSTDGTEALVRQYDDPRIQLVSQENSGPSHARNVGMARARGNYISLLDADDWYGPRHLERTTGFLDAHPECTLVATNFCFVNAKGEKTIGFEPKEILGRAGDGVVADFFSAAVRNRCFPVTCGMVFRKDLVASVGGFDESLDGAEDQEFQVRCAMKGSYGYIDDVLGYYRDYTPGSVRKNLGKTIRMRVKAWEKLTSAEPTSLPCWSSYAKFRSFYLFRLIALAIATGYFDEAKRAAAMWPRSPGHLHWWMGQALASAPKGCKRLMHVFLRRFSFVKQRQGVYLAGGASQE